MYLTYAQMAAWLDAITEEATLVAPVEEVGVWLYRPVEGSRAISPEVRRGEFSRPTVPVKEFFFPPSERLLTIEKTGTQVRLVEVLPEGRQVIFGVRPCEARGVNILDALFLDKPPADPYYARRRANAVLVGLACEEMGPTCFCTSVGGAPDDPTGMDVMLRPVENGYLAEAFSERGEALLKSAGLSQELEADGVPTTAVIRLPLLTPKVPIPEGQAWSAHFSDDYWERLGERCLSCRLCAYVCPTCRCFDLRDEALPTGQGYERLRCWDSCAGAGYRRIAGGHNPRASKGQRLRNRMLCKFDYYPQQYGLSSAACTGCGRCIDLCPVGIDITEVLGYIIQ